MLQLGLSRPMAREEAEREVQRLRAKAEDLFQKSVIDHEFTRGMVAGRLPKAILRGMFLNWFTFSWEINSAISTLYHHALPFLKRHMDIHDLVADKIGDELMNPGKGGHVKMLFPVGEILGLSERDLIEGEVIPEGRALIDCHVRLHTEGPLAESFASALKEAKVGRWLGMFHQALIDHYGATPEQARYFSAHDEADNEVHEDGVLGHGSTNALVLQRLLEEGLYNQRPGFTLDYTIEFTAELYRMFLDGVMRRYG